MSLQDLFYVMAILMMTIFIISGIVVIWATFWVIDEVKKIKLKAEAKIMSLRMAPLGVMPIIWRLFRKFRS